MVDHNKMLMTLTWFSVTITSSLVMAVASCNVTPASRGIYTRGEWCEMHHGKNCAGFFLTKMMLLLMSIIICYYMNTLITLHQCIFNLLFALFYIKLKLSMHANSASYQRCADMYPRIDICGYPQFFADTDRIRIFFSTIMRIRIRIRILGNGYG